MDELLHSCWDIIIHDILESVLDQWQKHVTVIILM